MRIDYYNDFDPGAAAWLRELMSAGHIPAGRVDDRSILDVEPDDLAGFRRCHFFAGIAGWSEALRLAGWPEWLPVWTGSPPCQPFSAAGKRDGRDDARHLGPRFIELVRGGRPPVLFGEQVASADVFGRVASGRKSDSGRAPEWAWIDDLFDRLEAAGYAAWALDIPAAGVGAPHIRQRCFFAAVDLQFAGGLAKPHGWKRDRIADGEGRKRDGTPAGRVEGDGQSAACGEPGGLADDARGGRREERSDGRGGAAGDRAEGLAAGLGASSGDHRPGPTNGFWGTADWLACRDGSWRAVEPGLEPLAYGVSGRVGLLRGYGNAIVPQVAAEAVSIAREVLIEAGIWDALRAAYGPVDAE